MEMVYSKDKRRIKFWLGCLLAAMAVDGLITWFFVTSGLALEGNPFLRYWVRSNLFLVFKLVIVLLIIYSLWTVYKWYPRLVVACTIMLLVLYTSFVLWNVLVLI
jgi:hypothetical protein